ncbi:hypothetical protein CapIbe_024057 [Capra ibex]
MRAGENVTLRCHSLLWFDEFILHQENSTGHFQRRGQILTGGPVPADFFIGPMTSVSVGTYRCYGSLSRSLFVWSAPSDPVDIIITGWSRKPSLSAQGGPLVRSEENVTLVCSSESAFDQFHLLKETEDLGQLLSVGWGPRGALQAEFRLGPGTPAHSGVYRCYGSFTHSPYSWSDPSDPPFLSVTGSTTSTYPSPMVPHTTEGEYDKPSLSAWPSPMVPLGQTVTLQCHFRSPRKRFKLFKTDGTSLTELHGNHFNTFTLGPVTREHPGSYTCSRFSRSLPVLSRHSDPLQIVVTGVFTKPSISAHPSRLMSAGENMTLRCQSLLGFDKFILHQENSTGHFQRRGQMLTSGHAPADFSIGLMTLVSAGTYRCYGSFSHSPYVWSAPSDPVDIIISGLSKKPSLSAQGGPVVRSGENVTLVCSSESAFDQFHLLRDGENLECPLAGGQSPHGTLQAEFPLGPGTPDHSGVYRCYGSFTRSPYSWSDSSDPLFLSVTR